MVSQALFNSGFQTEWRCQGSWKLHLISMAAIVLHYTFISSTLVLVPFHTCFYLINTIMSHMPLLHSKCTEQNIYNHEDIHCQTSIRILVHPIPVRFVQDNSLLSNFIPCSGSAQTTATCTNLLCMYLGLLKASKDMR